MTNSVKYYVDARESINDEFTPNGVWPSLGLPCLLIGRGQGSARQKSVVELRWQKCTDWLPDGDVIEEGILSRRGMRSVAWNELRS